MKRPATSGIAVVITFAGLCLALGALADAGSPYLPLIGPSPLRVAMVRSPAASVVKFTTLPAKQSTNSSDTNSLALSQTNSSAASNTDETTNLAAEGTPLIGPNQAGQNILSQSFPGSVFEMPTPDLLGITPQTLATYFRPVQRGTNGTTVIGVVPLSFMPPVLPEKDKSSHAEYIVK